MRRSVVAVRMAPTMGTLTTQTSGTAKGFQVPLLRSIAAARFSRYCWRGGGCSLGGGGLNTNTNNNLRSWWAEAAAAAGGRAHGRTGSGTSW
jgi:hypothetical protein